MARVRLLLRRKWTDEVGNLYEMVMWRVDRSSRYPEGVRYRLAFISEQAIRNPRCSTTITTRRVITVISVRTRRLTLLPRPDD